MELLLRFLFGGAILSLVSYLSTQGMPQLAGIIMTFPVITFMSLMISPPAQQKQIALWGLVGVGAFVVFVLVYLLFIRFNGQDAKMVNLLGSLTAWVILVAAITCIYRAI